MVCYHHHTLFLHQLLTVHQLNLGSLLVHLCPGNLQKSTVADIQMPIQHRLILTLRKKKNSQRLENRILWMVSMKKKIIFVFQFNN